MTSTTPVTEIDPRFSQPGATPTDWEVARARFAAAEIYWLATVRADGRPHVTPLIGVWLDGAVHFATGPGEQKARNLEGNPRCSLTTGCNSIGEGLDIVVEGEAVRVSDEARLGRLADAWVEAYGEDWRFEVRDGGFGHEEGEALVFAVAPVQAFGFAKGATFSQTRWRFPAG